MAVEMVAEETSYALLLSCYEICSLAALCVVNSLLNEHEVYINVMITFYELLISYGSELHTIIKGLLGVF